MTEHVEQRIEVDGPYFEDFTHGQVLDWQLLGAMA